MPERSQNRKADRALYIWRYELVRCCHFSKMSLAELHPRELTWIPKMMVWKRQLPLKMAILGIYFRFLECIHFHCHSLHFKYITFQFHIPSLTFPCSQKRDHKRKIPCHWRDFRSPTNLRFQASLGVRISSYYIYICIDHVRGRAYRILQKAFREIVGMPCFRTPLSETFAFMLFSSVRVSMRVWMPRNLVARPNVLDGRNGGGAYPNEAGCS